MKNILRGSIYFLILLILQIVLPMEYIFRVLGVKDIKGALFINHIVSFFIPAIIYIVITKQSIRRGLRLNKLYIKDILLIIILAIVCQPVMTFFSLVAQLFYTNDVGVMITGIVDSSYIILLLLIAVMPAITEEITIRGIILSDYEELNTYVACILTGLLFGMMHLNPQQFLYTAILGMVLALVVKLTNSIFASMIIHFIVNGTSITLAKIMSNTTTQEMMTEAEEVSLMAMPLEEKVVIIGVYFVLALAFGIVSYFILRALAKANIKRGTISKDIIVFIRKKKQCRYNSGDVKFYKIANILVGVLIVAVYIFIMNIIM